MKSDGLTIPGVLLRSAPGLCAGCPLQGANKAYISEAVLHEEDPTAALLLIIDE